MLTAAFTVTVQLRNPLSVPVRDAAGNVTRSFGDWLPVPGCRVGTDAATEQESSTTDVTVTSYRVRFPVGVAVSERSQVMLPGLAEVFAVDGAPLSAPSSFTAFDPGPLVTLQRSAG